MPTTTAVTYKDKFIAFVDVLGFKQFVEKSVAGEGMDLPEILAMLEAFGKPELRTQFEEYGPTICPEAQFVDRNLGFRLTQISDCVIISAEVSHAAVINLISHCATIVVALLRKGITCRGYVTRGPVYHTDSQVIGTGYQSAFAGEGGVTAFKMEADERRTPFVEVDRCVSEYVEHCGNDCVRMMYRRIVKSDGEVSAVFPFDRLSPSFVTGGFGTPFDLEKERRTNDMVGSNIQILKQRIEANVDRGDAKALKKGRQHLRILDEQLAHCDSFDQFVDALAQPAVGLNDSLRRGPNDAHLGDCA